jgi:S-adenosylhomocysteine hydrolase
VIAQISASGRRVVLLGLVLGVIAPWQAHAGVPVGLGKPPARTLVFHPAPTSLRPHIAARLARPDEHAMRFALAAHDHATTKLSNPEMPAFAALVSELGKDKPFAGVSIGAVQHLLGSTGGLLRGLADSGAAPGKIHVSGKTYSQNPEVIAELAKDGFRVRASEFESSLDVRFGAMGPTTGSAKNRGVELLNRLDDLFEVRGRAQLEQLSAAIKSGRAHGRYLLIDDGGELIELVHHEYPELHDHIVAVEQTTKGKRRLEALPLRFPVVDVAGSEAKRVWESPMIGRSVAKTTSAKLADLRARGVRVGKKVLVLGFGAIGRASAEALKREGYEVHVFDPSEASLAAARDAGFAVHTQLDDALPHGEIVVGATGTTALDAAKLAKLPNGAVLVNAASSATEFVPNVEHLVSTWDARSWPQWNGRELVTSFQGKPFVVGKMDSPVISEAPARQDWVVRTAGKELLLVNQGQVVNFDGSVDPIPPRYIQLTRGLLYLAAVQAVKLPPGTHGLVPLDAAQQQRWVARVQADLARTGESLEHPTF